MFPRSSMDLPHMLPAKITKSPVQRINPPNISPRNFIMHTSPTTKSTRTQSPSQASHALTLLSSRSHDSTYAMTETD